MGCQGSCFGVQPGGFRKDIEEFIGLAAERIAIASKCGINAADKKIQRSDRGLDGLYRLNRCPASHTHIIPRATDING
jgi:hypothetical protein